jgi:NADPH:quinone reductase-like Zn-dependent oxidoreductase
MAMSKAITFSQYGGPEVLHLTDVAEPQAGLGQVRVRIKATGVNPVDWKIRRGLMAAFRPVTFPSIPGVEFAGIVDQVGQGASAAVGDEVLGAGSGTYAEFVVSTQFVPKPRQLSWPVAGGLVVAARTAHRALEVLGLKAGETLLVHAAAGGVGSLAVQLARERGATVIGTASAHNHDYLRTLGATPVTYGSGLVQRVRTLAPRGVDAVFDAAGHGALPESIELTGGPDRVVTIADPEAAAHNVRFIQGEWDATALSRIAGRVAAGDLILPIARTYPLSEAASAQQESEAGHVRGKIILLVN